MNTEQPSERTTTLDITPTWSYVASEYVSMLEGKGWQKSALPKLRQQASEQLFRLAKITDHLIARRDDREGKPKPDGCKGRAPNWQGLVRGWYLPDLESKSRSKAALERRRYAEDQILAMAEIADDLIAFEKARTDEVEPAEV